MRIPLSLIQEFVPIEGSCQSLANTMTQLGLEVDHIQNETPPFSFVIAADVISVEPHPEAKKLQIAQVFDGTNTHQVVCGAPNCREGLKVAFAQVGARLLDLSIQKSTIRGVDSFGMLCSEQELGLSDAHEGILELPKEILAGTDLQSVLWDPVFEISLTPNLGHCMSGLGIAREVAAGRKLSLKPLPKRAELKMRPDVHVFIENPDLCPLYAYQLFDEVQVAPSPFWLQNVLKKAGIKPICNVVDITNYLLIKYGQPLHAFDRAALGTQIRIAPTKEETQFLGLDEIDRLLPKDTLCIWSHDAPVAIAGVLGGLSSAVKPSTTKVLLEAAVFSLESVRKSSKQLSCRTESAQRFEKGIDAASCTMILQEAVELFKTLTHAKELGGMRAGNPEKIHSKIISCRLSRIKKIIGISLSLSELEELFHSLGFSTTRAADESLSVTVPYYRHDITQEIDLIEEAARIFGYQNLKRTPCSYSTTTLPHDPAFLFEKTLRHIGIRLGLQEVLTADLISPKLHALAQEMILPDVTALQALHAKTEEYSIVRTSLLPQFLQIAKHNLDHKNGNLQLFEVGRIHFLQKEELVELPMLGCLLTGQRTLSHWSQKATIVDFYDLKGLIENFLEILGWKEILFKPANHLSFHPYRALSLYLKGKKVGSFGELHPSLLSKMEIEQPVLFAEIDALSLRPSQEKTRARIFSTLPASERDLTVSIPLETPVEMLFDAINELDLQLLEKSELIDLYFPENTLVKNVTFRFTYRDAFKTISFEETEKEHTKITESLSKLLAK